MNAKRRLSASVDADLLRAAEEAATSGQAATVSAWVNDALRLKVDHDRRLQALAAFVEAYEGEHGVITPEEIAAATRRARSRAVPVRTLAKERAGKRRRSA